MLARIHSETLTGLDGHAVEVEADVVAAAPAFTIVGLPDAAVQESRERVRAAIVNSGYEFPSRRITVNLAPADVRKEGPSFDLPIALAFLAATSQTRSARRADLAAVGELGLDGSCARSPARSRGARAPAARLRGSRAAGRQRGRGGPGRRAVRCYPVARCARRPPVGGGRRGRRYPDRRDAPPDHAAADSTWRMSRAERRQACARGRGGRRAQPAHGRARPARARRCSPAGCRRSCRRCRSPKPSTSPHLQRRRHVAGRRAARGAASVPGAAPQHLCSRPGRRRQHPRPGEVGLATWGSSSSTSSPSSA